MTSKQKFFTPGAGRRIASFLSLLFAVGCIAYGVFSCVVGAQYAEQTSEAQAARLAAQNEASAARLETMRRLADGEHFSTGERLRIADQSSDNATKNRDASRALNAALKNETTATMVGFSSIAFGFGIILIPIFIRSNAKKKRLREELDRLDDEQWKR